MTDSRNPLSLPSVVQQLCTSFEMNKKTIRYRLRQVWNTRSQISNLRWKVFHFLFCHIFDHTMYTLRHKVLLVHVCSSAWCVGGEPDKRVPHFLWTDRDIPVNVLSAKDVRRSLPQVDLKVCFDSLQSAKWSFTRTTCDRQCAEHQQQYPYVWVQTCRVW